MNLGERIAICRKARNQSQMELAAACGWENQGRVNNYEKNRREPTLKDIQTIAKALYASPEWLAYGIGSPPDYLAYSVIPEGKGLVVEMGQVYDWYQCSYDIKAFLKKQPDSPQPFRAGQSSAGDALNQLELITTPNKNRAQYGVRIFDDSMVSSSLGSRSFKENDIIIADPSLAKADPKHAAFVIALQKDSNEALFRQLILNGKKWHLRALNTQYDPIPFDNKTMIICALVIESRDILIHLS